MIPPNKDLSILHGVLHLLEPAAPRGLRLPIDFFFRSLADDRQDRSIGVILSGMGSDGTLGLRAIKEKAGVVFVQDAGLGQVRRHAAQRHRRRAGRRGRPGGGTAGQDHRLSPARPAHRHSPIRPWESKTQSALEKVFILLRTQTGHDFSLYKKSTIYRRDRAAHGPPPDRQDRRPMSGFCARTPRKSELLFKELLIGVTSFFRDPAAWEQLQDEVIPALLAARPTGGVLRAWAPGCSTGEEAYSLAMVFKEALEQVKPAGNFSLQIFATDLDRDAIDKARAGRLSGQHRRGRLAGAPAPVLCHRTSTATGWARRSARW